MDPIGEWRADYRLAYLASLIYNLTVRVHGKKGAKTLDISEFMLQWGQEQQTEEKQQSMEDMKKALLSIASYQNRKVGRKIENRKDIKR